MDDVTKLRKKTKIGMLWNAIERISVQGVSFIIGIILARLLTPDDYGTMGLMTVFISVSNVFVDSGFSKGLIQKIDRTEKDFTTTLIFNVMISCLVYIILFFSAPIIAKFYEKTELVKLSRVLFLTIILSSLTVVQSARLQIELNFKKIALINFISISISGVCGIFAAYVGFGVWALVFQKLIQYIILVILYFILGHWIPKTGFSMQSFKDLFSFGSKLLLTGLLSTTIANLNSLVIGKVYTSSSLGYYTRAEQFPQVTSGTLTSVLQQTTFPMMAAMQNDKKELLDTFKIILKYTALLSFPAMIGLALISKTLIVVLLSEKWLVASEYLFWLALSYIFTPLEVINLNLLNAIGRSDLNLKLDLIKTPLILLSMIITIPISLKAVVIGRVFFVLIYYCIDCYGSKKIFDFGPIKQILEVWKIIISSLIMGSGIYLFNILEFSDSILKLIIQIIGGIIIYVLSLFAFKETTFLTYLKKIKLFRK